MLDKDLAELYGVKPIRLREQVKRNIKRFPEDFMFQLTKEETDILVSQIAIPSKKHLGGHLPYVFTEQGVAMLSSVLNSERAIMVNIQIIRAFTKLREMLATHADLRKKIEILENEMINDKMNDNDKTLLFDRSSIGKSLLCVNKISLPLAAYRSQHIAVSPTFTDVHSSKDFLP
jgi:phage regulator Rha-like protein